MKILEYFLHYAIIQAILLAVWLIATRRDFFLVVFYVSIAYLIFSFLFEINRYYTTLPHLLWTNVPLWFVLAPSLYIYLDQRLSFQPLRAITKFLHFVPFLISIFYMHRFYILSGKEKIDIYEGFYSQEVIIDYVQFIFLTQISIYLVVGFRKIHAFFAVRKQLDSNSELADVIFLTRIMLIFGLQIVLALGCTFYLAFIAHANVNYYIVSYLVLGLIILFSTLYYLNVRKSASTFIHKDEYSSKVKYAKETKYVNSSLTKQEMDYILDSLNKLIITQGLYYQPDLRLHDVAQASGIPTHHISQSLNQVKNESFYRYINGYRVNDVKNKLLNKAHHSLTLEAISKGAGFKSQSSFYRIFKQFTGLTPKGFVRKHEL